MCVENISGHANLCNEDRFWLKCHRRFVVANGWMQMIRCSQLKPRLVVVAIFFVVDQAIRNDVAISVLAINIAQRPGIDTVVCEIREQRIVAFAIPLFLNQELIAFVDSAIRSRQRSGNVDNRTFGELAVLVLEIGQYIFDAGRCVLRKRD